MKALFTRIALCFIFLLTGIGLSAQTHQWVNFGKSAGFEYGNDITTDDSGNVYVAGQFEYTSTFGNVSLVAAGQHDIFVAKYNSAGTLIWIRQAGGSDGDAGSAIALDASGNVYVTGEFETTCKFTPTDSITSSANNDIFLVKYNNDGVFQWVKKFGGTGDNRGRAIAVDASGNSYISGSFSGTVNFGGQNLTSSGGNDIFIAKYNSAGTRQWSIKAGGSKDDRGRDITLDGSGNLYLTASYTQSANFSGTNISDVTGSLYSAAIVKYTTSGSLAWVRSIGGCCDTTRAYGPSVDELGNVYFTGYFKNQVKFGNITLNGIGNTDAFIAKYAPNGDVVWAKKYGGTYEDYGNGSAIDKTRKLVYFTGMFDYRADFDSINVFSAGNRDIWVSAVNYDGEIQWLKTAGGRGRDAGYAAATDTSGNIYHTGFTNDTAYFGAYSVSGYPLADYFVAKISPAVTTEPTQASSLVNASLTNCTNVQLTWNAGNGANRIVIARASSPVNALPVDGNLYSASSVFGSGANLGNGNFVVYNGAGNNVTVTGLTTGVVYHFAVIEYNGYNAFTNYYTSGYPVANLLTNSFSITATASTPAVCPGGSADLSSSGAVSYSWSPSTGLSSTSGATVTATPVSTTTYTVTGTNSSGCQAANQITVTVLSAPSVTMSALTAKCINAANFALSGGSPSGGVYSGNGVSNGTFSPATAGVGSHTITYSYTAANGCSASSNSNQVINALPSLTLQAFSSVCTSTAPFVLTGGSPSGGTYSGPGVSGGQFSPSNAGAGTHTIVYSYTNANACTNSISGTITVVPPQSVTLATFSPVCLNTSAFALSGGSPIGGTYSGPGVSGGMFNPSIAGVGSHTITYTTNGGAGCSGSSSATLQVLAIPAVSLSPLADVCSNTSSFQLSGGSPASGVYSGTAVNAGIFNPASSGAGTFVITYTYTGTNSCSASAQRNILVKQAPTVSFASLPSVCLSSSPFTLTGGSPVGGTYSGVGVGGSVFSPSSAGQGTHSISYTYIDGNSCTGSANSSITVIAPQTVTLSNFSSVCQNAPSFLLTGGSPQGGTYSGPGVNAGMFDPSIAGTGTHTITYSITGGGGCDGSSSATIQVLAAPAVSLQAFSNVCDNASSFQLSGGSPVGGVYSGNGVSAGVFSPSSTGAGSFTISYTVTGANSCTSTAQRNILVSASPIVSASSFSPVCINASTFSLSGGTPSGGTWSGSGVSGGSFSPMNAGSGTHTLTYTYTNASSCSNSASTTITVNQPPVVSLASLSPTCLNSASYQLSVGSPAGGTYSGPGVSGNVFNPSVAGIGTHSIVYSYSSAAGCSGSASSPLQVMAQPTVNLSALSDICSNSVPITLSGGSPAGGVYSGSGVSSGQFNPGATGPGVFPITYTYTVSSTCSASAQKNINVKAAPIVYQNTFTPVCVNSSLVILQGGSPVGGVYSGTGVNNGRFDPSIGIGNFNIVYTVYDVNGCAGTASQIMSVKALPVVALNFFAPICSNASPLILNGGTPAGGSYSGTGVSSGNFDPSVGAGTYLINYSYTDAFGCSGMASNPIQVNPAPVVQLNPFTPACSNASPVTLQGGTPSGGLYSGTGVSNGTFDPAVGAGNYTISYTYTDVNACSDTKLRSMLVNSAPVINLGSDTSVCANSSVGLNAGSGFSSVLWSTGSTSQSIQVDSSGRGFGVKEISVTVTNAAGCYGRDTVRIEFDVCAGIENFQNSSPGVYLYPNPFSTTLRILSERKLNINVLDVSGRLIERKENIVGSVEIGNELSAGTYFIEVLSNGYRKVFHVVKAN
ncbi:MAG: T9SS type A sorting domain-containing protein [Bacteroidetes bacterium]|nr:MAG: T9SS type A sorting domain-containing protein [Bacteroidota bacterium]